MRQNAQPGRGRRISVLVLPAAALLSIVLVGLLYPDIASGNASERARFPVPTYPAAFLNLCTSIEVSAGEQCDGYLEGVLQRLHTLSACRSTLPEARAFCSGSRDAKNALSELLQACDECQGHPDVMRERLKRLQPCTQNAAQDSNYCDGYNMELGLLSDEYDDPLTGSPRMFGRKLAEDDFGMAMFASKYNAFLPCVGRHTTTASIRALVLDFIKVFPGPPESADDRLNTLETVWRAIYIRLCPGPQIMAKAAERRSPSLEFCTHLSFHDGDYRTQNWCDKPVTFTIYTANGVTGALLMPGQHFNAGLKTAQERGVLYTTCPAGFVSSVSLEPGIAAGQRNMISRGEYECLRR